MTKNNKIIKLRQKDFAHGPVTIVEGDTVYKLSLIHI